MHTMSKRMEIQTDERPSPKADRTSWCWSGIFAVLVPIALGGCGSQSSQPLGTWGGPKAMTMAVAEPWAYRDKPGWRLDTPHYAIYTTVKMEEVRAMLPQVMEGAFAQYRELAPDVPVSPRPMDCYIFFERPEWNEYTKATTGKDSGIYLQIRRGGYAVGDRYVAYYIGVHGTASVAAHEGWHQFLARNFKGRLPPFLEEGIATTFEGVEFKDGLPRWNTAVNPLRAQALRRSLDEKHLWATEQLISMHAGEVVNQQGEKIEAFYAQCWAFAKFLREAEGGRYAPALRKWLAETADGTVFDPSHSHNRVGMPWNKTAVKPMLEHYLGMSMPEIDRAFQAFMHKVAYEDYHLQWQLDSWNRG